jgi:hypothetical protein
MWDLWWTKWHWGRFSPSTSVFCANTNSTDYSRIIMIIIIIIWNWYNRTNSGCGTKWTQSHSMREGRKNNLVPVRYETGLTQRRSGCGEETNRLFDLKFLRRLTFIRSRAVCRVNWFQVTAVLGTTSDDGDR